MKYQIAYIGNNHLHLEALTHYSYPFGAEVKQVAASDSVFANCRIHI
ncbi:hypothetical protein [Aurantivibrio plasticivorans]